MERNEIIINGLRIVYFTGGKGRPLLFLHGGRIRALTYKRNLELLAKKFMVYAPDIPGFGESDTPKKNWDYKNYSELLDTFMKKLQIKDVIVIGHSMGGGLAFHLASDSKLISKLVLVNANGVGFSGKNSVIIEIERTIFYLTSPQYWTTFFILIKDAIFHFTRHFYLNKPNKIRRDYINAEQVLNRINVPTLILWGDKDTIFPLKIGYTFKKWIKNSHLEIVRGTHDWILYNPELFYKKILFSSI